MRLYSIGNEKRCVLARVPVCVSYITWEGILYLNPGGMVSLTNSRGNSGMCWVRGGKSIAMVTPLNTLVGRGALIVDYNSRILW